MLRKVAIALTALFLAFGGVVVTLATVSSSLNKVIVAGNGSQTAFTYPFVGVAAADISAIFTDASGAQTTLTQGPGPTQYQLSLNAAVPPALWGIGGTVTYNPSGTPIASGTTLTIVRTLPYTQLTSLQNQASFGQLARATEQALDQLEMQIQQVAEGLNRVLRAPIVDVPSASCLILPAAAQRAGTGLIFDGSGCVIAGTTPSGGVISSAMQPVVNAGSIPAGRLALGLGSMSQENINGGTCGGASIQDDGSAGGANGVGFARVVLGTVADSSNQSVTCAFHLQQRIGTGPITYTLPRANTLFNGFGFWVVSVAGVITIADNANDNFVLGATSFGSGVSLQIAPGTTAFIGTNAAGSGAWYVRLYAGGAQPTRCVILSTAAVTCNGGGAQANNGTYMPLPGALRLLVRLLSGGGGGAGSGTGPGTAGVGIASTFGALTCPGGTQGVTTSGGLGGAICTGGDVNLPGSPGSHIAVVASNVSGGNGAASVLGGAGQGGLLGANPGIAAAANTGSGGGGAGAFTVTPAGGGGGSSGYLEKLIVGPAVSYAYFIGPGGVGGSAGTNGNAGAAGGSGRIIVDEYYN